MKAWLITWGWTGDYAAVVDKVVGILNPRWSEKRIVPIIEFLYNQRTSNLAEMAGYAEKRSNNPYTAKNMGNSLMCGVNPYLEARKVEELNITINPDTLCEKISWIEPPLHTFDENHEGLIEIRGRIPREFQRKIVGTISNENNWDNEKKKLYLG